MKGVLFSADFVKDKEGKLRLLEINTDTGILDSVLPDIDYGRFIDLLNNNNISELHIIYKEQIHSTFIAELTSRIDSDLISITTYEEDMTSIYPTFVEDAPEKFILRLSYDESAIFDSYYAKDRLNVYRLFASSNLENRVSSFYYKNDIDTLTKESNPNNIPDFVVKDRFEQHNPISFYKLGTENKNWDEAIKSFDNENVVIENFHHNEDNLIDGKVVSYRQISIIYGNNLDLLDLCVYKIPSMFNLPESLADTVDNSKLLNKLSDVHYYEYTTNYLKYHGANGFLGKEKILMNDGEWKSLSDINVGDTISSYYIEGSPDDDIKNWSEWTSQGEGFPDGSKLTTSDVMFKNTTELTYGGLFEIVVDSDSILCSTGKQFVVYEKSSNTTTFKAAYELEPDDHYLYDGDGKLIDIDEVNFYLTDEPNLDIIEIDVENADTYILSGSTSFNSIVSHNAPCFVAGTKILLSDGFEKNIEDIIPGDTVKTFNHNNNVVENKKVINVISKTVNETVRYSFDDNSSLECTFDHPIYSIDKGYVSYKPELTHKMYDLNVEPIEVGFSIYTSSGDKKVVVDIEEIQGEKYVYNLHEVESNHNYFANDMLVHNRSCFVAGTKVTTKDGEKNIEDIEVGELVLSWDEENKKQVYSKVIDTNQPVHDDMVLYYFSDGTEIVCTQDHPFYVNDFDLASYKPELTNERYELPKVVKKIDTDSMKVWKTDGTNLVIDEIKEDFGVAVQTYIITVEEHHNFYANGILVHNK